MTEKTVALPLGAKSAFGYPLYGDPAFLVQSNPNNRQSTVAASWERKTQNRHQACPFQTYFDRFRPNTPY